MLTTADVLELSVLAARATSRPAPLQQLQLQLPPGPRLLQLRLRLECVQMVGLSQSKGVSYSNIMVWFYISGVGFLN